ncbi:MAG: hypothetical protein P8Y97_03230 [Candidatus Lokiarchaeota archaeon]
MYKNVLNINFPRDLKTKEGKELEITKQDVTDLIKVVSKFIKFIKTLLILMTKSAFYQMVKKFFISYLS